MFTLSNLAFLVVSLSLAVNAAPLTQPSPDVGTVFTVYPGWDMNNGILTEIFGGTELACLQACSTDSRCVAYVYQPYGSPGFPPAVCVTKSSIDLSTFQTSQTRGFDVSSGLVGGCAAYSPGPIGPTSCFTVTK
ncbi:hypothetical protein B0H14DRAFT_3441572 [Mycena olivaceomarginata]|nr:hypothetical protein B0H14DRAFT_3441572 [Mycena olivaceomarginata]